MVSVSCEPVSCASSVAEPVEGNYFVAAYPPFSCWRKGSVDEVHTLLGRPGGSVGGVPLGLYVHIPFCARRCEYCYYLSYADRKRQEIDRYLDALVQELALYRDLPALAGRRVGFVYFGGGTPSLLPPASVGRLMSGLQALFPWATAEEVTFECAPRSVTRHRLEALRSAGVNRISLGVQQLDDEVLRLNGRIHLVADVVHAWEEIQAVGFEEVNFDLIAGLVGETDTSFREGLERVIRMAPDSVTIYPLEVPLNTPLYRSLQDGTTPGGLPTWPTKRARVALAFSRLEEAGYVLRSAYAAARNGRHRRFAYQEDQYRGADLLGIGVSSLSYIAGAHYQNVAALEPYLARLQEGRLPVGRAYLLDEEERLVREFVLQLKLGRAEAAYFRAKFGVALADRFAGPLAQLMGQGLLTFDDRGVTLTREGLLRVDRLLPAFYLPAHQGVRYS